MEPEYFNDLYDFNRTHNVREAAHYANITRAVQKTLMYNFDTGLLVPRRVFDLKLDAGEIDNYSTNPDHPVFWNEDSYTDALPSLLEFRKDIDILVSGLNKTLATDESLLLSFVNVLYYVEPEILMALRVHLGFQDVMASRAVWEALYKFDARTRGEDVSIPIAYHIDRLYLAEKKALWTSDIVEIVSEDMKDLELEAMAMIVCDEMELLPDNKILLLRGQQEVSFSVIFTQDGVEIKRD